MAGSFLFLQHRVCGRALFSSEVGSCRRRREVRRVPPTNLNIVLGICGLCTVFFRRQQQVLIDLPEGFTALSQSPQQQYGPLFHTFASVLPAVYGRVGSSVPHYPPLVLFLTSYPGGSPFFPNRHSLPSSFFFFAPSLD